jgi:glycosyltransferase involved in cell wall biosynthesis
MSRRVLYLAWAPFFSGAERALLLTLQSLDAKRYEPYVVCGTDGEFVAQTRALGIPCHIGDLRPFDARHPLVSTQSVAAVARAARRYGASVIHSNEVPSFQPGGYAARLLRIPSVTHVRFFDHAAGYRWFLRSKFSHALFVSENLMTSATAEAPDLFAGRSSVLYDAVEPQAPWSADGRRRMRQMLGLPTDRTIVAITGQIAEVKGIREFVTAAHILASRGTEPFFAVLGDDLKTGGAARQAMEAQASSLGLSDRFTFLGFRKDAPQIVQAFDIIAVPSHVEPLGNATLEAMAAGRPVVGTRVGGIPEMIVDEETGTLVPPMDPGALANAIGRLVIDAECRARMSEAARARATDQFGLAVHGRRLQSRYDALLAERIVARQTAGEVA